MTFDQLLEKKIIVLMAQVKRKQILPYETNIGKLFNKLKELDLPTYERLVKEYKQILKVLQDDQQPPK